MESQQYSQRTALFDYHGKPEYEEVREILDKYNISENKYKAYCSYTILDWNTETECDRKLEEYVSEHSGNTLGIGDVFQEVYNYSYKEFDWKMNTVAIAAWILWIVFVLSCRRWSALLPGICLAVSKTAVWGALIWMGRMPYRIVIPLFACETMHDLL